MFFSEPAAAGLTWRTTSDGRQSRGFWPSLFNSGLTVRRTEVHRAQSTVNIRLLKKNVSQRVQCPWILLRWSVSVCQNSV